MSKMTSKYSFKKSLNRIFLHDNDTPTRHELLNENCTGRHGTRLYGLLLMEALEVSETTQTTAFVLNITAL